VQHENSKSVGRKGRLDAPPDVGGFTPPASGQLNTTIASLLPED